MNLRKECLQKKPIEWARVGYDRACVCQSRNGVTVSEQFISVLQYYERLGRKPLPISQQFAECEHVTDDTIHFYSDRR